MIKLEALTVERKTGAESFLKAGTVDDMTVLDFWRWAVSDLVSNTARGVLAEYIVASALGCSSGVREEWAAYDLTTPAGITVEVKSAAYVQTWKQKKHSPISFGISPTVAWDANDGESRGELKRQADVYVFCLLATKDQEKVDPLDLDQWRFYLLPTRVLDEKCGKQKNLSLSGLRTLGPAEAEFVNLADALARVVGLGG